MDGRHVVKGMMVRVGLAVFGMATLVTLVLTLISDRGILAAWQRGARLAEFEQQIEELEAENASMIEEIRQLKEEPAAVERRAREELKLVRPGEVIIVLPPETDESD